MSQPRLFTMSGRSGLPVGNPSLSTPERKRIGGPVQRIATQLGVSRPMVWRWQQRFAEEGVDGLYF